MDGQEIKDVVTCIIEREAAIANTRTRYRQPLVAFANIKREEFQRLKEIVGEHHLLPDDLLPGAESVVAFFLPFSEELIRVNMRSPYVAKGWAVAYVETNNLISHICEFLVQALKKNGIEAAWELPTYNFDREKLVARWSHKSVAALTGLGSFGLNRLLITDSGCAGRYGSLLLKARVSPNTTEPKERCLYFHDGTCSECVQRCPVNALTRKGELDRATCYKYLLEVDGFFDDLPISHCCGKCSVGLPCSLGSAVQL